ncbi:integrin alpha-D [Megalops cyprinoides]|uniref:integrin alpha-D n=1 Tax=Megalops cyprinoides TaxID=118141 RepID=UPI0018656555|nr:integrin alpha-D [Megalops cyprinoides]
MSLMPPCSLLTILAAMVLLSMAFNIDDINTKIYSGDDKGFFGYRALQYKSEKKWIIVSAPLEGNGTGGIYKCSQAKDCELFHLQDTYSAMSTGIAMAVKSTSTAQFTACSPRLAHECDSNSYLNGICYQFNNQLQLIGNITPAFQECTKRKVDLVFLFDGSESLKIEDFKKNKEFIADIMKTLSNTSIQFAAVQFSKTFHTVFTFTDYQNNRAWDLLDKEQHMKSLTNTHGAIDHVLNTILYKKTAGAIQDATKVLVIITDGSPTDIDVKHVVKRIDDNHIIRYIIGVKYDGKLDLNRLKSLASDPKDNNTFYIDNYSGLKGILDNLQKKIYNIEGTQSAYGRKFKNEMSQSGFSAVYMEDTLVLGSVGSNDWRGSLIEIPSGANSKHVEDPKMEEDSYMGYSVAVGRKGKEILYFSGAPRFNHTGQVLVFHKVNQNWEMIQGKHGTQIGAYFGAELCAVDIDSDGETDFLLVGAPLYYDSQREGRMFVYNLTTELVMWEKLNVTGSSLGRFASSISSLEDLNGDGLRDVAVGAPLEDGQKGAVYIYLGDRLRGIRPESCQRIAAQIVLSTLQFFGQAIDGKMDMEEDGLTDIIVGAYGKVVLFRSRPVLNVSAQLHFTPAQISTDKFHCLEMKEIFPVVTLTACFMVNHTTSVSAGSVKLGLIVSYQLDLDSVRQKSRAFLNATDKGARRHRSSLELSLGETCLNHTIYMPNCVKDTLSPMMIKLNFSQSESPQHNSTAVLNTDVNTVALVEVPFQKNCKRKETCVSDLELDFNFMTTTLLVVDQEYFNVTVTLSNHGDDSYNTSITFHYPHGLSFSKMQVLKATRRMLTSCSGLEDIKDRTVCSVSLPVYPSETTASFYSLFRISNKYNWSNTMEMTITAHSDNGNTTNIKVSRALPVQFAVDLAVVAHDGDSITYVNFSLEDTQPKMVEHVFEVKNLGFKDLPVKVTITFQTQPEHNFVMKDHYILVSEERIKCGNKSDENTQDCSGQHCKSVECESFTLNQHSSVFFTLHGNAFFQPYGMTPPPCKYFCGNRLEGQFSSTVELNYDKQRYVQTADISEDQDDPLTFHRAKIDSRAELIIPPNQLAICMTGIGLGLVLLAIIVCSLYKLGFFKRKYTEQIVNEQKQCQEMSLLPPTGMPDNHNDSMLENQSSSQSHFQNQLSKREEEGE